MKKQHIAEIEQRLLLREILEIKKSTSQSEKRIVESTWSTLQCLKKKKKLKLYRRITNIVLKKKKSSEIEQRLLL